jgi:hypothetical protein
MKWKSQKAYLKHDGQCPRCGSGDINGGFIEVDGAGASQEVSCNDCNAKWIDLYKLVGYQKV